MSTIIVQERPDTADALLLIDELESYLAPLYPAESRHGFSVEKLLREGVAFFVLRFERTPAGCGGIKFFGTDYGEIKRMYVRQQFRGLKLSRLLLNHLADYAVKHGVTTLRLKQASIKPKPSASMNAGVLRRFRPLVSTKKTRSVSFMKSALGE